MPAPIPSIPRIRCAFAIILILIGFMLLGLTRRVFAFVPCAVPSLNSSCNYTLSYSYYKTDSAAYSACQSSGSYCLDLAPNFYGMPGTTIGYANRGGLPECCANYCNQVLYIVCSDCPDGNSDGECGCSPERAVLEQQCGGPDKYVIDEATCQGSCNNNGGGGGNDPCYQQRHDLEIRCGSLGYTMNGSCEGTCNAGGQRCIDERRALMERCGGADNYTIDSYTCEGACVDSDGDGIPDDEDTDDDGDGIPDSQDPDDDGDGTSDNEEKHDYDSDGIPDLEDSDDDGDGKNDEEDPCSKNPDPSCTDPCAGSSVPNCKDSDGDGTSDDKDECPSDPDSACEGGGGPDADGDGVPDSEDTDDDGDGIPDSEDTDDDGDGTPDDEQTEAYQPKEGAYTYTPAPETGDIGQQFNDRFTQFIEEIRATSIFSIPGQIFSNVPSGGSSTFTFYAGETFGEQEFSMESWVPGLAALRGILYIAAAWAAVKIALLGV